MTCAVETCERAVGIVKHGLCRAHYERWRRTGDIKAAQPLRIVSSVPKEPKERKLRRRGICARGHVKTGTSTSCQTCQNLWSALTKVHHSGNRVSARRLYVFGDREHMAACWAARYGVTMGAGYLAADRLRRTVRIKIDTADRWCTALGTHLCLLYPELYMDATMDVPA